MRQQIKVVDFVMRENTTKAQHKIKTMMAFEFFGTEVFKTKESVFKLTDLRQSFIKKSWTIK